MGFAEMNIRGIVKFSLIDYPGKIACVIFVGCCNFRCPYCHNPHLVVDPESQPELLQSSVIDFLEERRGKLDAVVVSGGEPTLRPKLMEFLRIVKGLGLSVKIDTNGTNTEVIQHLNNEGLVDSLGIDYKAPKSKYAIVAGRDNRRMIENVFRTLEYAVVEKIHLDVRTTVHKALLDEDDLKTMRNELDDMGIEEWTLQQFNPVDIIDENLKKVETFTNTELVQIVERLGGRTKTRGIIELMVLPPQ